LRVAQTKDKYSKVAILRPDDAHLYRDESLRFTPNPNAYSPTFVIPLSAATTHPLSTAIALGVQPSTCLCGPSGSPLRSVKSRCPAALPDVGSPSIAHCSATYAGGRTRACISVGASMKVSARPDSRCHWWREVRLDRENGESVARLSDSGTSKPPDYPPRIEYSLLSYQELESYPS